ncbi:MAG: AMP-binding protein [Proteobacteria bacterium]|nr:AMP-binding protein [Pseudomonadota bacterium]
MPAPDRDTTLFDRFLQTAACHADRVALGSPTRQLTYRELAAEATRVAAALHRYTPATGAARVAIAGLRSIEGIVAMLGALGAGAVVMPIEGALPTSQAESWVRRARPDVFIETGEPAAAGRELMQAYRVPGIALGELLAAGRDDGTASDRTKHRYASERPALAVWSTGVDGRPGASLWSHRNVLRLFDATERTFEFGPDDIWLMCDAGGTAQAIWQVFGALLYGGQLVMPAAADTDAAGLASRIASHRVTVWNPSTTAFRAVCGHLAHATADERAAVHLSFVLLAGERPEAALLRQWYDTMGDDTVLVQLYGMAEAGGHVAIHALGDTDARADRADLMGEPVADLRLQLLDDSQAPVPPGAIGELHIAGAGLAHGYDAEPARTAAAFVPDRQGGERLLRTGDLARMDGSGRLVRLGRADRLLRIRGLRVLLDDVEAGLRRCGGVHDAAVLRRAGTRDGDEELDAWIVPNGDVLSLMRLRSELSAIVPRHALPQRYFEVPALVADARGNVDAAELRATGRLLADDRPLNDPASEDERSMLDVWSTVLEVPGLGVSDDFFAAGGDSMLAVKLVLALGTAGWQVTVQDLLQAGSVRNLLDGLPQPSTSDGHAAPPSATAIAPVAACRYASDLQNLLIDRYARHAAQYNGVYHIQQAYTLVDATGSVDLALLRRCYEAEFAASASCRTYFERTCDGYRRLGDIGPRVEIAERDIAGLDPRAQQDLLERYMQDDLLRPFDMTSAVQPLTRLALFRLSPSRARLVKTTHHAIDDGWGQVQFVTRVLDAYERGTPSSRAHDDDPFDDYVAHQRRLRDDPAAMRFWNAYPLASSCLVGADRAPPARIEQLVRPLSNDIVTRVHAHARRMKVQPKAVCLAAVLQALGECLDRRDVTVGMVVNGRLAQLRDALTTTGLYWNLQPCTWQDAATALQSVGRVHELLARQDAYTLYPLSRIFNARAPGMEFRFTFNYTNYTNYGNAPAAAAPARLSTEDWSGLDNFHYPINIGLHCDEDPTQHNLRAAFDPRDALAGSLPALLARAEILLARLHEPAQEALAAA